MTYLATSLNTLSSLTRRGYMSKSLELITRSTEIVNKLVENGGELTPELDALINGLSLDTAGYADRVKYVIDELDNYSEKIAERAKRLSAAKKALDGHKDFLADRLKFVMGTQQLTEVKGQDYVAKVSKSAPKLAIFDEAAIPQDYKIITYELDKDMIKKDLEAGLSVPGATLTFGTTLRWSINKG